MCVFLIFLSNEIKRLWLLILITWTAYLQFSKVLSAFVKLIHAHRTAFKITNGECNLPGKSISISLSLCHISMCVCVFLHDSLVFYVIKMQFNLNITNKNIIWFHISYTECIFFVTEKRVWIRSHIQTSIFQIHTSFFWFASRFQAQKYIYPGQRGHKTQHIHVVWTHTYRMVLYYPRAVEMFSCARN